MSDQPTNQNQTQTPDFFNERLPGETAKAFEAFKFYRDLTPADRSIEAAFTFYSKKHRKSDKSAPKTAPRHWGDWSSKYQWPARASASDRYIEARRRAVREQLEREDEETQFKRRKDVQERAWKRAEAMGMRVDEMLKHPIFEQKIVREVKDGNGNTIQQFINVSPSRWSLYTTVQMAELSDRLARLATGMSTDNIEISLEVKAKLAELKKKADEAGIDYAENPVLFAIFQRAGLI